MKLKLLFIVACIIPLSLISRDITVKKKLYWEKVKESIIEGKLSAEFLICQPCGQILENEVLPQFSKTIPLARNEYIKSVRFVQIESESVLDHSFNSKSSERINLKEPKVDFSQGISRQKVSANVSFIPLLNKNGSVEKITYFELVVEISTRPTPNAKNLTVFTNNSVLSSGQWFKIGIDHDGIYKISYSALKNQGIDVEALDPSGIRVFGNGGAMLPRLNSTYRPDDLLENAIYIEGESDGSFDKKDYILFYGQGPHKWIFNSGDSIFYHSTHQYSDTSYYFIQIDGINGKRIASSKLTNTPNVIVNSFDDYAYHEVDKVNILNSGDDWYGEVFDIQNQFTFPFSFPNVDLNTQGHLAAKVSTASKYVSDWTVSVPGSSMEIFANSAPGSYGNRFAHESKGAMTFLPKSDLLNVIVTYNKPPSLSSAKGWLDYLEINVRRGLKMAGPQLQFRDLNSINSGYARFDVSGANSRTKIWDVSDPSNIIQHNGSLSGNTMSFVNSTNALKTYMAINEYDSSYTWAGSVANQNLHDVADIDYIMISHPRFLSATERLKAIHELDGKKVVLTTPQKIYNEFSSGAQDIVAIRDFVRMIYNRAILSGGDLPKYLLFMGDGSVDNKYRISGNSNYIPTFQSNESGHPGGSYVSDDFYCMLDSNEGEYVQTFEQMDLAVGRMPVQSIDQANAAVTKVERYLSPQALGDWRNTICFVADDEDGSIHMNQADQLSSRVDSKGPDFNVEKIFTDAYKQYSTPGGNRYPDAQEAIKRRVERGALIVNYTGHGGEVGWAHERILTMDEINNWTNKNSLPLFFTATCEFSRWDDPGRTSGGEVVFLNPDGGGIALLTTVRLVFSSTNHSLAKVFYDSLFSKIDGEMPRLGDLYMLVKNETAASLNTRNFTLLGDPGLRLAYPYYQVVTTSINGKPVSQVDTVGALGLVEMTGYVADLNGNKITSYNGTIYPTIFDKRYDVQTLANDNKQSPYNYDVQDKKLFRGKASVTNGDFKFKFVVPKDIAYNYGNGKVSYYGENLISDANGYSEDFIVGGTDANAKDDVSGPDIELFMNDYNFVYGGITDENPLFIAKVYDEHGINMAGTGIGHDISVMIDGQSDNQIALNEYYAASIDSYQEGEVRYPFEDLEPGPHKLSFKVWDVYNNSSEAILEFVVEDYKDITLNRVLNYPNPFTTNTSFWFEHNQPNTVMDVNIQIFTISGKVVKTIDQVVQTEGYSQNLENPISWNGLDEYGDKLGKGVYIYKLKVRSRRNGTSAEKIEKLVIL